MSNPVQHLEALDRANEVRIHRAQTKRWISALAADDGAARVAELLSEHPPELENMSVTELVGSIRRVGKGRVARMLRSAGVGGPKPMLGSLTERQKSNLRAVLRKEPLPLPTAASAIAQSVSKSRGTRSEVANQLRNIGEPHGADPLQGVFALLQAADIPVTEISRLLRRSGINNGCSRVRELSHHQAQTLIGVLEDSVERRSIGGPSLAAAA